MAQEDYYSPDGYLVGRVKKEPERVEWEVTTPIIKKSTAPKRRKMTEEERLMKSALNDIWPETVEQLDKHEEQRDAEHTAKALNTRTREQFELWERINKLALGTSPLPDNPCEQEFERRADVRQGRDGGSWHAAYAIERNLDPDLALKADARRTADIAAWEAMQK